MKEMAKKVYLNKRDFDYNSNYKKESENVKNNGNKNNNRINESRNHLKETINFAFKKIQRFINNIPKQKYVTQM